MTETIKAYEKCLRVLNVVAKKHSSSPEVTQVLAGVAQTIKTLLFSIEPNPEKVKPAKIKVVRKRRRPRSRIGVGRKLNPEVQQRNNLVIGDYAAGFTYEDIAEMHDIKVSYVYVILSNARKAGDPRAQPKEKTNVGQQAHPGAARNEQPVSRTFAESGGARQAA